MSSQSQGSPSMLVNLSDSHRSPARFWLTAGGSPMSLSAQNNRYGLQTPPPDQQVKRESSGRKTQLKIAMVAPLAEAVPPSHYGGTERVVSVLTEELVRRG